MISRWPAATFFDYGTVYFSNGESVFSPINSELSYKISKAWADWVHAFDYDYGWFIYNDIYPLRIWALTFCKAVCPWRNLCAKKTASKKKICTLSCVQQHRFSLRSAISFSIFNNFIDSNRKIAAHYFCTLKISIKLAQGPAFIVYIYPF